MILDVRSSRNVDQLEMIQFRVKYLHRNPHKKLESQKVSLNLVRPLILFSRLRVNIFLVCFDSSFLFVIFSVRFLIFV
jgi:hypothetical protein